MASSLNTKFVHKILYKRRWMIVNVDRHKVLRKKPAKGYELNTE